MGTILAVSKSPSTFPRRPEGQVQSKYMLFIDLRYFVHFQITTLGKGMNSFILLSYELNSIIPVLLQG